MLNRSTVLWVKSICLTSFFTIYICMTYYKGASIINVPGQLRVLKSAYQTCNFTSSTGRKWRCDSPQSSQIYNIWSQYNSDLLKDSRFQLSTERYPFPLIPLSFISHRLQPATLAHSSRRTMSKLGYLFGLMSIYI